MLNLTGDHHGCDRMVVDLQLPLQSLHITTKVVSSNPAHHEQDSNSHDMARF